MSDVNKNNILALLGLVFIILVWSYNWVVLKSVSPFIAPFDITALRCLLGALVLFFLMRLRGISLKPPPFWPTLLVALLQTCGMNGFSQWALVNGGAGKIAILTYTMPFWVILLAVPLLKERMNKLQYAAIAVAFVGLMLILKPWDLSGSLFSPLLAILAGFSWAASAVVIKLIYRRYPGLNMLSLTVWQMLYGAIVMSFVALSVNSPPIIWNSQVLMALAYCGILATAIGWAMWSFILKHIPAGIAGISTLPIPIIGVLLSWWLLGERPDNQEWVGIMLIALALVGVNLGGRLIARKAR